MTKLKSSVKVRDPTRLRKAVTQTADKSIWNALEKVQNKTRKEYRKHVGGYKRLSKFLKTSRDRLKSGDIWLNLEVSAAEGRRRGADITHAVGGSSRGGKRKESISAWNDIAYQIEYGTTRKGNVTISARSQLMSIPIHPDAKDKSPRDFPYGKWIKSFGKSYFITLIRGGTFRKPVPSKKAKGPVRRTSNQMNLRLGSGHPASDKKYKFLFVGVRSVTVKEPKPYWVPTLKTMFGPYYISKPGGEMLRILKQELGKDFELK